MSPFESHSTVDQCVGERTAFRSVYCAGRIELPPPPEALCPVDDDSLNSQFIMMSHALMQCVFITALNSTEVLKHRDVVVMFVFVRVQRQLSKFQGVRMKRFPCRRVELAKLLRCIGILMQSMHDFPGPWTSVRDTTLCLGQEVFLSSQTLDKGISVDEWQ